MTHTPGPWESMKEHMPFKVGETMEFQVAEEGADPFDGIEILDLKKNEVLIVPQDMIDYSDELASFAVLALNSYLDLLDALEELVDLVEATREGEYEIDYFTTQPGKHAIAKAKGRPPKEKD